MKKVKIYTEEQVIALTKAAFTSGQNHNPFIFEEELKNLTPIELPSDEEIEEYFKHGWGSDNHGSYAIFGAKWLKDKIQGGNE